MYIGYVQFLLLVVITLKQLGADWFFNYWYITFPISVIIFLFGSLLVGYLDVKVFKIQSEEAEQLAKLNPILMAIKKTVEEK